MISKKEGKRWREGSLSRDAVSWTIRPAMCACRCHAELCMPAMLSVHTEDARTAVSGVKQICT